MKRRHYLSILLCLTLVLCVDATAQSIPAQLSDQEFWKLSTESSEPDGRFRSDNLLSNENWFQYVIPELNQTAKQGRVYLGVGPEQNFTYMAALKPTMAFIIDIRRGNLDLQLMYKALFELSKDRAEFVSRLFSKPRPDGLSAQSTALQIFAAYSKVPTTEALYKENLKAIQDHLVQKHSFPLGAGDLEGIDYVLNAFYSHGPDINYSSTQGGGGFGRVTYEELMVATDEMGQARSYLANEENFAFLKNMQAKNLVIPVIGNFGGPKAIRAVASYLKGIDATVSAFYLSNVEQYLRQDGILRYFCANAAALPLDQTSTFIRSVRGGRYGLGTGLNSDLGNMTSELKGCSDIR
ncbi:MAG TPA: hypothetical protein VE422_25025 [Terriglobia bacterium]|nr:hypothetical protein [Terriglobia bacterium]